MKSLSFIVLIFSLGGASLAWAQDSPEITVLKDSLRVCSQSLEFAQAQVRTTTAEQRNADSLANALSVLQQLYRTESSNAQSFSNQVVRLQRDSSRQTAEIEKLKEELAFLKDKNRYKAEIDALNVRLQEMLDYKAKYDVLVQEKQTLEKVVKDKEDNIRQISQERDLFRQKRDSLMSALQAHQRDKQQLQTDKQQLQSQIQSQNDRNNNLQSVNEQIKLQVAKKENEAAEARGWLKSNISMATDAILRSASYEEGPANDLIQLLSNMTNLLDLPTRNKMQEDLRQYLVLATAIKEANATLSKPYDKQSADNALARLRNLKTFGSQQQKDVAAYERLLRQYCEKSDDVWKICDAASKYMPDWPQKAKDRMREKLTELDERYVYLVKEANAKYQNPWHNCNIPHGCQ